MSSQEARSDPSKTTSRAAKCYECVVATGLKSFSNTTRNSKPFVIGSFVSALPFFPALSLATSGDLLRVRHASGVRSLLLRRSSAGPSSSTVAGIHPCSGPAVKLSSLWRALLCSTSPSGQSSDFAKGQVTSLCRASYTFDKSWRATRRSRLACVERLSKGTSGMCFTPSKQCLKHLKT